MRLKLNAVTSQAFKLVKVFLSMSATLRSMLNGLMQRNECWKKSYLVMSQSLEVEQSSAYCFARTIGARQTLAPPTADTSHTKPDSQSASRRQSSPSFRPQANKQFPITKRSSSERGRRKEEERNVNKTLGIVGDPLSDYASCLKFGKKIARVSGARRLWDDQIQKHKMCRTQNFIHDQTIPFHVENFPRSAFRAHIS